MQMEGQTMKTIITASFCWLMISQAAHADRHAEFLKAHYPHGIHELKTNSAKETITWDSQMLENDSVKRDTQTFKTHEDFKTAFVKMKLHTNAYSDISGMWDAAPKKEVHAEQNEALLKFIREQGYQESGFANLKKYYSPLGNHFIDPARADGNIRWTSQQIVGDRILRRDRLFASVEEFTKAFQEAKLDKQASISVHTPALKSKARRATGQTIVTFLKEAGYVKAGGVAN